MIPKRLARKVIYENKWVNLYLDKVQFADGHIIEDMHLVSFDIEAVGIVVLNEKNEVLLIKSHRYHTQSIEWEIPAGCIDDGEKPVDAAIRETFEETGYTVKDTQLVIKYNPTNGSSDQVFYIYKAYALNREGEPDPTEVSEIKWVSKETVHDMLRKNEINCGFSLVGLMSVLFCDL